MTENTIVWEVFIQSKNGLAHKHVGNVHADGEWVREAAKAYAKKIT